MKLKRTSYPDFIVSKNFPLGKPFVENSFAFICREKGCYQVISQGVQGNTSFPANTNLQLYPLSEYGYKCATEDFEKRTISAIKELIEEDSNEN